MSYKELTNTYGFYQSSKWLHTASYIRKKYNYVCQVCGKKGVYVHHINPLTQEDYINKPLMKCYGENNLTLLCYHCHEKEHSKKRIRDGLYIDKNGQIQLQSDNDEIINNKE